MAQTIKLKRSSVSGNTPGTSDLELGEVAINTYDGKMFIKKNDGSDSIVEIGAGSVSEAFKTIAVSGQSNVVADSATDTLTLVAGSNMTITTNASGDTITFASSGVPGSQNVFTTFAVSGQNNVVADGTTDTLTLVAGSGIGITTNSSTDTITITNTATGANAFGNIAISGQTTVAADSTNDTLTLVAGTGITLTTDASTDEITIANSATGANAFGNILVSGQSTVAADTTNDNVTFIAGSNMTITTNASGDTVTFASSGGGSSQNLFSNIAVSGQGTIQADATTDTLTFEAGSGITLTTDTTNDKLTITSTGGSSNVANAASSIKEFKYDISSSTTTITGSDANSNTLAYEAGAIQVFLNGILLDPATDYTASNGTSVVLTDAAVNGDDVQIVSFNRKIVTANVGIDTFTGNGSTTAYTLSSDPINENNTRVHIDGVYQEKAAYSISGTTLTFSAPPPNNSSIEVEVGFTQAEIGSTLDFADNAILRIGTGNDLQILHDGSNSIIKDTGTGDLQIAASTLEVKNAAINETMIKAIEDGAVELYHNNNKKLETATGGVTVTGTVTATTFSGDLSGTINTATTGTTQSASDNSTKLATTAYVTTALSNLVDSAPGTLNTLNELAAALGDDANFSTTITNSLATKVGLTATTGAASIPAGTTGQRPGSPAAGQFRYNSTLNQFEGYTSSWGAIGGGGTNTFTTDVFTANGSTAAFTLTQAVSSPNDCIVHVDGIYQTPTDAYGVSGTTLTFTATPANGRKIVVYSVKAGVSGNNLNIQTFSGNGSATSFTMNVNPINENNTIVHIDGVYQQKTSYSTSGTTISFSAAPANGTTIEVATFTQTEINVPVNDTIDTVHIKDDAVTSAKLGGNLVAPGTVTASAGFVGPLTGNVTGNITGNVTGNVSGTAATVTGAAQTNITSLGTLTALTVDNIGINGDTITLTGASATGFLQTSSSSVQMGSSTSDSLILYTDNTPALTIDTSQNATFAGTIATGGITINGAGSTITDSSDLGIVSGGTLTVDVASEIVLDTDDGIIRIRDAGGDYGMFQISNSDFIVRSMVGDKDLIFRGNDSDGGGVITALTLDMSEGGRATFNEDVIASGLYVGSRNASYDFYNNGTGYNNGAFTVDDALTVSGRINFAEHIIGSTSGGYLQVRGSGSRYWAIGSTGGNNAPTTASATLGFHHYDGSSWAQNSVNITASGKLGVGTDNPDTELHVFNSNSGATPTGNTVATFEGNDNTEISILGGSSSVLALNFGHSGDNNEGIIYFNTTSGSENMQLQSTKDITYQVTSTNAAAGHHIFKSHNTEIMRIDGQHNRVGIGTQNPSNYTYGDLVIDGVTGSGNASGISLVSSNTSYGGIFFADGTSGDEKYRGFLQYNHNYTSMVDQFLFGTGGATRMVLSSAGKLGLGTTDPQGDIHLQHGSTNTFTASNDSWHTMVLHNNASAASNTTGIALEVSGSVYHGNAGTGIAAVKNGTNSDYGADLTFITRPQSAVAKERYRIKSTGRHMFYGMDANSTYSSLVLGHTSEGSSGGYTSSWTNVFGHRLHLRTNGNSTPNQHGTTTFSGSSYTNFRIMQNVGYNGVYWNPSTQSSRGTIYEMNDGAYYWVSSNSVSTGSQYTLATHMWLDVGGNLRTAGSMIASYSFSDERLKQDVEELPSALDKVKALRTVKFNWINEEQRRGHKELGLIAQEVKEIYPELVHTSELAPTEDEDTLEKIKGEERYSMEYEKLSVVLLKAMQEQQELIETLQAKVAALEAK